MKENLALLDLDGTLYDTLDVNYLSYREALSPCGVNLDKDYFASECNGRHYTEFLSKLVGDDKKHIEQVHKEKKAHYKKYLASARENSHLFNILLGLKKWYYLAVVTTASRQNAKEILRAFNRLDIFDGMITQEDTAKMKPDPQGFLLAMERFGIAARKTVIFEDSEAGIEAARSTGAAVIIIDRF